MASRPVLTCLILYHYHPSLCPSFNPTEKFILPFIDEFNLPNSVVKDSLQSTDRMATEDVKILKQSGIIAVRHANGNLRIPGFKRLENCDTTVDMDQDPEVFMMLEPALIVRKLNKAIPNSDIRSSARRLRFIFKAVILFFEFRVPNGEKMLREKGIDNLPDEVFDDIKAALAQSDGHFSGFSAMAIKRCLQLFTENVLDHASTALTTGQGDTTTRDLAREAWEAVKHFQAMLSQDWSTIARSNYSITAGTPTKSSLNVQQLIFTSNAHRSSSSFAGTDTEGGSPFATRVVLPPGTTTRGHGDARDRATKSQDGAPLPSSGPPPRSIPGTSTAGQGQGGSSSGLNDQEVLNLDSDYSPNRATASPTIFEMSGNPGSGQSTPSALGKHERAEPDLDETKESRPTAFRKHKHTKFKAPWTQFESFYISEDVDLDKALQERYADRYHHMNASDQHLVREVLTLRERVRNFEKEKEEALAEQRRQLRPGLVTMKMSSRVQERVNQLFGSTGNGTGSKPARSSSLAPASKTIRRGGETIEEWLGGVDEVTRRRGLEMMPASTPYKGQDSIEKGPYLPPIGYFKHPRATQKEPEVPKLPSWKTSRNRKSKVRRWNTKTRKFDGGDSGEESEVPTESSWASAIPA